MSLMNVNGNVKKFNKPKIISTGLGIQPSSRAWFECVGRRLIRDRCGRSPKRRISSEFQNHRSSDMLTTLYKPILLTSIVRGWRWPSFCVIKLNFSLHVIFDNPVFVYICVYTMTKLYKSGISKWECDSFYNNYNNSLNLNKTRLHCLTKRRFLIKFIKLDVSKKVDTKSMNVTPLSIFFFME